MQAGPALVVSLIWQFVSITWIPRVERDENPKTEVVDEPHKKDLVRKTANTWLKQIGRTVSWKVCLHADNALLLVPWILLAM